MHKDVQNIQTHRVRNHRLQLSWNPRDSLGVLDFVPGPGRPCYCPEAFLEKLEPMQNSKPLKHFTVLQRLYSIY